MEFLRMEWILALSIFITGCVGALIHYYVRNTAKKEADIVVKDHALNCPLPCLLRELHKDVREIRDVLLKKDYFL
jgi:hypothetical protein